MYYFFDCLKQKLSQKVILTELEVEVIPIVAFPLNVKKVPMKFLYVIKNMKRLKYKILKKI